MVRIYDEAKDKMFEQLTSMANPLAAILQPIWTKPVRLSLTLVI